MSVVAVDWIFLKVLKVAKVKGLVDNPDARKLQKVPVPVLGGIAVFFGVLMGLLVFRAAIGIGTMVDGAALPIMNLTNLIPVLVGASVMLYVGAMNDIVGLTPRARLVIEVLTVQGLVAFGNSSLSCSMICAIVR